MEKHKIVAIGIVLAISLLSMLRDGVDEGIKHAVVLGGFLLPILFYRVIAFFAGFGLPEYFAKDFKSENHPGPYAFFFWILFLIACGFVVFQGSLY
jgi:hypothetical protein